MIRKRFRQRSSSRVGVIPLVLFATGLCFSQAVASEGALPIVRAIDGTHMGKPDDSGDAAIYLKPDVARQGFSVAGNEVGRSAGTQHGPILGLLLMLLRWRVGS